jgi:putative ABC transport system ATP-binding protein
MRQIYAAQHSGHARQAGWGSFVFNDEPTGNLDSRNGREVMTMLTDLNRAGTTIVMVTHSEHDAGFAQRIIRMLDGQTVL